MRKRCILLVALALCLTCTGCAVLPEQTDAADEAILRVVAMGREDDQLKMIASTSGSKASKEEEPVETCEGSGKDYVEARDDMKEHREAALTHVTDWVIEESTLGDALEAFVTDPELNYSAYLYFVKEQSVQEFMDAFDEESSAAKVLGDLDRALGKKAVTMLEVSAKLAAGEPVQVPVLKAEDGKLEITEEVELREWK